MIYGVGTDIVKTDRISSAKESFLHYAFTEKELAAFKGRAESLAGNFAAKEAVGKALGTGISGFGLKDIEILRDERGKPYVMLHGGAAVFSELKFYVSISHEKEYAVAYCIAEREEI